MATEDLKFSEWERSKISNQDANLLKKLGFMKKEKMLIFPGEENFPTPRIGYRVTFVDHLIRGLATPIHEFIRGLLFVYGLQLHQLTPNSILHISIFITLCECFLGTPPKRGLWKCIFLVHRNSSHNTAYNVGGVVICVRPDVEYFDVKFPDSVQGWGKRWLYIHEEDVDSQEYNVAPFDGSEKILRLRSWDAEATDEEKTATEALTKRIHELQNTRGKELSEDLAKANKRADDLAVKLEKSEKAREKAEQNVASVGDLPKRLHEAETALSDKITQQIDQEEDVIGHLESQNRLFSRKMGQDFELEEPEGNHLRDALSLLEIHGDLARRTIFDAKTAFTCLFPYFFPRKDQPSTFAALTKCFIPEEDLGLALRQENLKIGFEGTIALVAESQQNVYWAKAGETKRMKTEKWQALIRAAEPHSKKILSFLGYKPAPSSSSAKPEVCFSSFSPIICHSKLEMTKVVETVHAKLKKRRRFVDKIDERVTPVAEEMIDDLLRMDADFFMDGHYADFMGASADEDRVNIDDLIGHD
ncbi:hypothetical protein QYE76_063727 [Lolium multiflorum]|uniref:Transposase (putative) gypsy type domain-containing protein n=1 Tax=Lolium multiflorum TaxID=4521 RepID=A0AAD8S5J0_LOLMU|nr:hypothetical protein QYE76_063727 [Lolium multiflorum]